MIWAIKYRSRVIVLWYNEKKTDGFSGISRCALLNSEDKVFCRTLFTNSSSCDDSEDEQV